MSLPGRAHHAQQFRPLKTAQHAAPPLQSTNDSQRARIVPDLAIGSLGHPDLAASRPRRRVQSGWASGQSGAPARLPARKYCGSSRINWVTGFRPRPTQLPIRNTTKNTGNSPGSNTRTHATVLHGSLTPSKTVLTYRLTVYSITIREDVNAIYPNIPSGCGLRQL